MFCGWMKEWVLLILYCIKLELFTTEIHIIFIAVWAALLAMMLHIICVSMNSYHLNEATEAFIWHTMWLDNKFYCLEELDLLSGHVGFEVSCDCNVSGWLARHRNQSGQRMSHWTGVRLPSTILCHWRYCFKRYVSRDRICCRYCFFYILSFLLSI